MQISAQKNARWKLCRGLDFAAETGTFLRNLVVALLLGLVTSVAWELPLANIQKLVIGSFVSQLSKKTFPKMDSVHFDASRWPSACLCREFIETPLSRPQP